MSQLSHPFGFGYGCDGEPKVCWSKIQDRQSLIEKTDFATVEDYLLTTCSYFGGWSYLETPKQIIRNTNGVTCASNLRIEGAGISEVNGLYILDTERVHRGYAMWHHESGGAYPELDGGRGGGSSIVYDLGSKTNRASGFMLFYRGGIRYVSNNAAGSAPSAKWFVYDENHSWDGVMNSKPAPTSHHPDYCEEMKANLDKAANEEQATIEIYKDTHSGQAPKLWRPTRVAMRT